MDIAFSVFVHLTTGETKTVSVRPNDAIWTLFEHSNTQILIARGHVLIPEFTFAFFGLKEGDHIYVLQKRQIEPQANRRNKSLGLVNSSKRTYYSNNTLACECARLLDLFQTRIESNFFGNKRAMAMYKKSITSYPKVDKEETCYIEGKMDNPSTDSLPVAWKA